MTAQFALPWWHDLTPRQIAGVAEADGVAILPLAAIEQHGEHLPLSTDLDLALGLLQAALPKLRPGLPVCVLPPLLTTWAMYLINHALGAPATAQGHLAGLAMMTSGARSMPRSWSTTTFSISAAGTRLTGQSSAPRFTTDWLM